MFTFRRKSAGKGAKQQVGVFAAKVEETLQRDGPMTVYDIYIRIKGMTVNEVLMAIGWLACENRIDFVNGERPLVVSLRANERTLEAAEA